MAAPPPLQSTTDAATVIELDEEIEGEGMVSRNYRFSPIGQPVPIKSSGVSWFDPQSLPSQPLAVSERFGCLFVAHPQGFYVARTKDVIASAEEIEEKRPGSSIQELSLVDVPIGKVSILALSADDSLLAASIDSHVHFFAVAALLLEDQKPLYSVSVDDSICIKDLRWARKVAKAYLVLSSDGKLYHGSGQGPLIYVMEGVDSADWSVKGNFVAVAKKNAVSILSSQFQEKFRFLLPFQSLSGDSDANQVIKVDSIRWIRPDSIAVGCFQANDDGEEENYILQVITSRGQEITDVASKPIVSSFNYVFMDFSADAVPTQNGPHLILSYLDFYGVAFVANRKNPSRTASLFCWPQDNGKNEAKMVDMSNDEWALTIQHQGDGEDNVIVGLCVDKVSQNEDVRFTMGDVEMEGVSPCCVIIYLTIDGKISVSHFASTAGAPVLPEGCDSGEDDDASQVSMKHEPSHSSSAGGEGSKEPIFSMSQSHQLNRTEVEKTSAKATITNDLSPSFNADIRQRERTATESMEQKPLCNSEKLKVDDIKPAFSIVLNQDNNAENQSTSEVKHGKVLFSGNVVGDVSHQSVSNYPISGSNVEPLHKVSPPTSTSSIWSLTRSSARVDASKTSDGRFLSFPSDEVDNSNKHALQSAGGVQQHPADLKEKPSGSFTSFRQTGLAAQGNRNSLPAYPGSQVPFGNNSASGKNFQSEFKMELNAASSPTLLSHFAQSASKQFANVGEMAKKLDNLLEGIEGKGGFRDASINSQTNSVTELEEGIWALSDRCRTWKVLMNEQERELHLLLDKTVQVVVRKLYMEGIFKQASDSRYWELWNRQKLSSELELKRRHILELNQKLSNMLIELERHFNSLEFNKFRENEETQRNQRASQNLHGHSRQIQSLHSLYNTTTAQLAAAEQLSGCLSKQMAALSIESSGKHDVKRQLFESIGLTYVGDNEISPARSWTSNTPANKEYLVSSGSIAAKEHSRRNQSSFVKVCEPETARRRRDSLDCSWASFDPPKTTVKRMPKEDYEKRSSNQSLLNINKQYLSPRSQKKSEVAHSALPHTSGASLNHYKSRGIAETSAEQSTESPSSSLYHGRAGFEDQEIQLSSTKSFSALPPSSVLEMRTTQNSELAALRLSDEKSKSSLPFTGKNYYFAAGESKFVQQSDTGLHPLPSVSRQLPEQSLTSPSDSTGSLDHFNIGFTKPTAWGQKTTKIASETPLLDAKVPVTPTPAFSSGPYVSDKGLFSKNSEKLGHPSDAPSASSPLQSALGSSLLSSNNYSSPASLVSKPSSSTFSTAIPFTPDASAGAKQEVSQLQTSNTSAVNFPSTVPSSTHGSNSSSAPSSSSIIKSESPTSLSYPSLTMYGSKIEGVSETQTRVDNMPSITETGVKIETSGSQPVLAISTSDAKIGPSASSTTTEVLTNSKSGNLEDLGGPSKKSSFVTSVIKVEMPSATETLSTVPLPSEGNSSHVEEMEEEAPETDQTTGFSFANLDGFGIGSTQNAATPKENPFGVLNKNTTFGTSPYMMSASSGELFRPASFNFQSPQPPAPLQPTTVSFSGGFGSGVPGQVAAAAGFGQPANVGAGQQALGSVLGTFGQSRQLGTVLPGSNAASASGFGSGFMGMSAGGFGGGFTTSGSGFASLAAPAGGGFAAAATSGGGFAAAAASANAGGGFTSSATAGSISGGGFGAFNTQPGSGGFSAFGGGSGTPRPPSELFTQMRK